MFLFTLEPDTRPVKSFFDWFEPMTERMTVRDVLTVEQFNDK